MDPELVVPDPDLSIEEGAIAPWGNSRLEYWERLLQGVADAHTFKLSIPWKKLPKWAQEIVLYTIGQMHELVAGFRILFSPACT